MPSPTSGGGVTAFQANGLLIRKPALPPPSPFFQNVTDRLALEARLQTAQNDKTAKILARLHALLDPFPVGVLLLGPSGKIDYANSAACNLTGMTAEALSDKSFASLLAHRSSTNDGPEAPRSTLAERSRQFLAGEDRALNRPDGAKQIAHVTLSPLPNAEGVSPFLAVLEDVTAHHETLALLMKELQAAKQESAQKSQFLANVGHELRTPLNAIIGFSEIMRDQRLGPLENARYRQYAKDIHHSGHLLLSLINDLLDLSKVQAGKLKLQFSEINLRTVVEQCMRLVQPQAQKKKIRLHLNVPPVLPLVKADARSLEQGCPEPSDQCHKIHQGVRRSGSVDCNRQRRQSGTARQRHRHRHEPG